MKGVLAELFLTGRIVDLILALVVVEAVLLFVYRLKTNRGVPFGTIAPNLLSGASLLLALRFALVQAWWGWIAVCLSLALLTHLADLRQRWSS